MPGVTDRDFWLDRDPATRGGLIRQAEERAAESWPVLTAGLWRDYARTGNRVHYEDPYFARRDRFAAAVLAAALTDSKRWHDEVTDGIWQLCEETTWCIPPHERSKDDLPDPARPTLDLFAAETGALLAWAHSILAERLSPITERRLRDEVRARVLVPQRTVDDWVWIGLDDRHVNNWNPWINSNVLACSFLLDVDPGEIRLTAERAVRGLERFMADYPADGGCSEGAQYWWRAPASLFECLQTMYDASGGALDAFGMPLLAEMGRYLHRVHIDGEWYVNVADGPARLDRFNASAHLLYRYGKAVKDQDMTAMGRSIRGSGTAVETKAPIGRSLARTLLALADEEWANAPDTPAPYIQQAWLKDTQLVVAREEPGSSAGLFVSIKGGHNAEDHNHNDIGTFLIALDGHPVVVDVGVAAYTRKHFSPQRYEIWTLRSDYHNVPQINGHEQAPGREFAARDMTCELSDASVTARLDLAQAYPNDIQHWWRDLAFDREAGTVTLEDSWELPEEPATLVSHLMVSGEPRRTGDRLEIPARDSALTLAYPVDELEVGIERIDLEDRRLKWVWGERTVAGAGSTGSAALVAGAGSAGSAALWRISFTATAPERTGSWKFLFSR